jgi:pantothenate kinase type III
MGINEMAKVVWVVEKGNSRWKYGVFVGGDITLTKTLDVGEQLNITHLPEDNADEIFLTGSGKWSGEEYDLLQTRTDSSVIEFKHGDRHPLITKVANPGSLGTDRVANVFAIQSESLKDLIGGEKCKTWMIIDVGTCVTTDVIQNGVHIGGSISPGISLRLNSMRDGTAALPEINKEVWSKSSPFSGKTTGISTVEAMIRGAADGISAEIIGRWMVLNLELGGVGGVGVVITGGDSSLLELCQVKPKFADSNLTLKGYYALFPHIQRFIHED